MDLISNHQIGEVALLNKATMVMDVRLTLDIGAICTYREIKGKEKLESEIIAQITKILKDNNLI